MTDKPPYRPLYGFFIPCAIWLPYWLWDHRWKAIVIIAMCNLTLVMGYELGRQNPRRSTDSAQAGES